MQLAMLQHNRFLADQAFLKPLSEALRFRNSTVNSSSTEVTLTYFLTDYGGRGKATATAVTPYIKAL